MRLLCRQIFASDLDAVCDLLVRGFPTRKRAFWIAGFERLSARPLGEEYPRYGYLLESDGAVVGVVLTIFSERREGDWVSVRCSMSSWHVTSKFQSYATLMVASAIRRPDVTYVNVSPAPHTRPIIEAQGFRRYCNGQVIAFPALHRRVKGTRIAEFDPAGEEAKTLGAQERHLIGEHVEHGCIALTCTHRDRVYPFVFIERRPLGGSLPCLHLAYCRELADFVRFAGPIGRALLARGCGLVVVDANGPIPGLLGRYFGDLGPKYYKGSSPPALGDLSYTEGAFFH